MFGKLDANKWGDMQILLEDGYSEKEIDEMRKSEEDKWVLVKKRKKKRMKVDNIKK
tara:strand:+ start:1421 stop:1588 length:168 start_codon:yes stop_codon:yes gene_type:complete